MHQKSGEVLCHSRNSSQPKFPFKKVQEPKSTIEQGEEAKQRKIACADMSSAQRRDLQSAISSPCTTTNATIRTKSPSSTASQLPRKKRKGRKGSSSSQIRPPFRCRTRPVIYRFLRGCGCWRDDMLSSSSSSGINQSHRIHRFHDHILNTSTSSSGINQSHRIHRLHDIPNSTNSPSTPTSVSTSSSVQSYHSRIRPWPSMIGNGHSIVPSLMDKHGNFVGIEQNYVRKPIENGQHYVKSSNGIPIYVLNPNPNKNGKDCFSNSTFHYPKFVGNPVANDRNGGRKVGKSRLWMGQVFPLEMSSYWPIKDFYESMLDLSCAKGLTSLEDLEEMFLCFIDFNSPRNHPFIQEAYTIFLTHLFEVMNGLRSSHKSSKSLT